jgi:lipid II:glycine glycyltransferase (peptidoglycan interpeptide bridge formation enzyme)
VAPSLEFFGHVIDLGSGEGTVFKGLRDSVRRALKKAQDARLKIEFATDLEAMREYYRLHCQTRKRHGVPPQPLAFFESIARYVLEPAKGCVVLARLGREPIAGAVFLHHGVEAIFKFGASDFQWQSLRPNTLVMWAAIQHYARQGLQRLLLGRTSLTNEGLRRFKNSFGAHEEKLAYYRFDLKRAVFVQDRDRAEGWLNKVFGRLPLPLLQLAGRTLYPHLS